MNGDRLNGLVLPSQEQIQASAQMRQQMMAHLAAIIAAPIVAYEWERQRTVDCKEVNQIVIGPEPMNLAGNISANLMKGCGL